MKQHPVPQHISSYEFKLVGDMTLKQFFQLAGGAIIALIIYATPLPGYVKWPFIFFFGAFGAALAFLPIEERPLSTWIFAFLKAIYAPTKFSYNASTTEDVFAKSSNEVMPNNPISDQYLSKPAKNNLLESFETAEKNFFNRITTLFQTGNHQPASIPTSQPTSPPPANSPTQGRVMTVEEEKTAGYKAQQNKQETPTAPGFKAEERFSIPQIQSVKVGAPVIQNVPTQGVPIPEAYPQVPSAPVQPVFGQKNGGYSQARQATFSQEASPPQPPERPNTIVGQVLSFDGKIIDGAILEIKDSQKRPVRAIRTNKVGHFLTVTPLADGNYEIETEKEGYSFDIVGFVAKGEIIPPIQIKAKA